MMKTTVSQPLSQTISPVNAGAWGSYEPIDYQQAAPAPASPPWATDRTLKTLHAPSTTDGKLKDAAALTSAGLRVLTISLHPDDKGQIKYPCWTAAHWRENKAKPPKEGKSGLYHATSGTATVQRCTAHCWRTTTPQAGRMPGLRSVVARLVRSVQGASILSSSTLTLKTAKRGGMSWRLWKDGGAHSRPRWQHRP